MRFFLISDNIDTQIGLRLVGVKGVVVHEHDEVIKVLKELEQKKDIGILILTEKIAKLIPEKLNEMRLSNKIPLVTVIPDRHGMRRPKDWITRYVQEAIGVKLDER
ncbi:MAG: ATP synthase subunit F [Kosmotoga sp.]|nr:MAG: ATP synthase subunit F [Kosmotoga sp.]